MFISVLQRPQSIGKFGQKSWFLSFLDPLNGTQSMTDCDWTTNATPTKLGKSII